MTTLLHVTATDKGPGLRLPLDVMTMAGVVYGARGSGKTTLGAVLAEEVTKAKQRFCAIDLKGDWYGLKSTRDGKGPGIPVVIFGGAHADLPLEEGAGAYVGEVVAGLEQSCILDLELLSKGKQLRFLAAFLEALYHHNREPLLLLMDEAQRYAPQKPMSPEATVCLGAAEDIVKLGRKHGIGPVLITQRGSGLNKEVSELCDLLIAFRTPGPLDQDRIKDWLDASTTKAQRDTVMGLLAGLETGTAVFASGHPSLRIFGTYRVRQRETFDSSATPKVGQRLREPTRLAQPDLERLRVQMADAIERKRADDPKALRAKLAEVNAELARARKVNVAPTVAPSRRVEVPILTERQMKRLEAATLTMRTAGERLARVAVDVGLVGRDVAGAVTRSVEAARAAAVAKPPPISPPAIVRVRAATGTSVAADNGGRPLDGPERKILTVLVQHGPRTRGALALLAGYTASGGGFRNPMSRLRSKGYIVGEGDGMHEATVLGFEALGPWEALPTGPALLEWWLTQLPGPDAKLLRAIAEAGPIGRAALATATGYDVEGGGFRNPLSRLRTRGLIEGKDALVLAEALQ